MQDTHATHTYIQTHIHIHTYSPRINPVPTKLPKTHKRAYCIQSHIHIPIPHTHTQNPSHAHTAPKEDHMTHKRAYSIQTHIHIPITHTHTHTQNPSHAHTAPKEEHVTHKRAYSKRQRHTTHDVKQEIEDDCIQADVQGASKKTVHVLYSDALNAGVPHEARDVKHVAEEKLQRRDRNGSTSIGHAETRAACGYAYGHGVDQSMQGRYAYQYGRNECGYAGVDVSADKEAAARVVLCGRKCASVCDNPDMMKSEAEACDTLLALYDICMSS
jgi:hypothetical protein